MTHYHSLVAGLALAFQGTGQPCHAPQMMLICSGGELKSIPAPDDHPAATAGACHAVVEPRRGPDKPKGGPLGRRGKG